MMVSKFAASNSTCVPLRRAPAPLRARADDVREERARAERPHRRVAKVGQRGERVGALEAGRGRGGERQAPHGEGRGLFIVVV